MIKTALLSNNGFLENFHKQRSIAKMTPEMHKLTRTVCRGNGSVGAGSDKTRPTVFPVPRLSKEFVRTPAPAKTTHADATQNLGLLGQLPEHSPLALIQRKKVANNAASTSPDSMSTVAHPAAVL